MKFTLTFARTLAAFTLLFGLAPSPVCGTATAQIANAAKKPRVLQGMVTYASGQAVQGAVVYLKNTNTLAIKTYVADSDGAFHFGQLGTDSDYQVWAEHQGSKSSVKTISAIENKPQFDVTLKIK